MPGGPLRVLIVDDTITYRKIVGDVLARIPSIEIVGSAENGRVALEKIERLKPDLLTLDIEMPEMDGLEVLRRLREMRSPVKAIMVSALTAQGAQSTVRALSLGAFDFVLKPRGEDHEQNRRIIDQALREKISAFVGTLSAPSAEPPADTSTTHAEVSAKTKDVVPRTQTVIGARKGRPEVVAIGVSTGGPESLAKMLPRLPATFPLPILIVQHMPPIFTKSLADSLNRRCALSVCEARDRQPIRSGNILLAPGGMHMKVRREGEEILVRITDDPPENSCKPAVDYLFRSIALTYGANAIGVIMTGMGSDGALGCRLMRRQGASLIAQDRASCVVYGMPRQPTEEGLVDVVAPLDQIAESITSLAKSRQPACR